MCTSSGQVIGWRERGSGRVIGLVGASIRRRGGRVGCFRRVSLLACEVTRTIGMQTAERGDYFQSLEVNLAREQSSCKKNKIHKKINTSL